MGVYTKLAKSVLSATGGDLNAALERLGLGHGDVEVLGEQTQRVDLWATGRNFRLFCLDMSLYLNDVRFLFDSVLLYHGQMANKLSETKRYVACFIPQEYFDMAKTPSALH